VLVIFAEPHEIPDVTVAILDQVSDIRSLEERRVQISVDIEDSVLELNFSYDFDFHFDFLLSCVE